MSKDEQEICVKTGKSNKHQNQAKFQNFKQFQTISQKQLKTD